MKRNKEKVTNEKKNLHRLAGEFLIASRLAQRGYMVALQWGTTISYDILVFDKSGRVAYIEAKSTGSNPERWILQAKYATPSDDAIPLSRRFVCCVDLTVKPEPSVYVFPAQVVANALRYFYAKGFSKSPSYMFALNARPRGLAWNALAQTVGEFIEAKKYLERYELLGVSTVDK